MEKCCLCNKESKELFVSPWTGRFDPGEENLCDSCYFLEEEDLLDYLYRNDLACVDGCCSCCGCSCY